MAAEQIAFNPSSHIKGIAYDEDEGTLVISFSRGTYRYLNVTPSDAYGFRNASSAGQYLETVIKPQYKFQKVG